MNRNMRWTRLLILLTIFSSAAMSSGCHLLNPRSADNEVLPIYQNMPREQKKVILPAYTIEPPDMLQIDAVNVIPKSPYNLRVFDSVTIIASNALPEAPIEDVFTIPPSGIIDLGAPYGQVKAVGMTVEQVRDAVADLVKKQGLNEPGIKVTLGEIAAKQQISGQHLVSQDGTVTLGSYGGVSVIGKTLPQAKLAIEQHLAQFLEDPEVSVDVSGFNSKFYYVITQGAGLGDRVIKIPVTGNETVLDGIAEVEGLTSVSSTQMWIARPGRNGQGCDQILPVDWNAITKQGRTETNYQVLPGDRIFVAEDNLVAMDNMLAKLLAPGERIFGFVSLGTQAVSGLQFYKVQGTSRGFNGF